MAASFTKNLRTCDGCGGKCCAYVCMELDEPRKTGDFDDMIYYLHHENVRIVVCEDEHERTWYVEFAGRCRHLGANARCAIYEHRPRACRDHDIAECEQYNPEAFVNIATPPALIDYLLHIGKKKIARKLAGRIPPAPVVEEVAAK